MHICVEHRMTRRAIAIALLGTLACAHSGPGESVVALLLGPLTAGTPQQLTYNTDQDYWPSWTSDGQGILYSFVHAGSTAYHRCVGLLPPNGGSRIWELCDNRAVNADSAISYPAYAIDGAGQLLYVEAVAPLVNGAAPPYGALTPSRTTLWLADTATPFRRTSLLELPILINAEAVGWLGDLAWTGGHSFIALAQELAITAPSTPPCDVSQDSTFSGSGMVLTGTIEGGHATLTPVPGTSGASSYSLAEGGATVVFTRSGELTVYRVPISGGTATPVATLTGSAPRHLLGASCRGENCVVASDAVEIDPAPPGACPGLRSGAHEMRSVSLADGSSQQLFLANDAIVTPRISPTGDLVYGLGGNLGHLQTIRNPSDANLYMRAGVLP
jgi:hypothetical protein